MPDHGLFLALFKLKYTFIIKRSFVSSLFYVSLVSVLRNMAKNGHVHDGGKVGRSNATPTKFFCVNSFDLNSMSFRFYNDIFIGLKMTK